MAANRQPPKEGGLFLEFNVTREPWNEVPLRRAMNYAINKDVLVKVALEGQGGPGWTTLCPVGMRGPRMKA